MSEQERPTNLMGAGKRKALRVIFDRRVKLEFHGSQVTSDAGLLAYRELDEALELTATGGGLLSDWRTGQNTQHSMVALLRQSLYSRLAGYEDTNEDTAIGRRPPRRRKRRVWIARTRKWEKEKDGSSTASPT